MLIEHHRETGGGWTAAPIDNRQGAGMGLVGFGQPDDGIIQMSYVVPDIRAAMDLWVDKLKVGPWFLLDHFTGTRPKYRGRDSKADVSLAMSFAGHMNIELIQPNDGEPSVYREWIDKRGHGFHHWGRATTNFDRDVAHYQAQGHDLAFLAGVPSGGNVAYMDTTAQLPGYVELIELGAGFETVFSKFYRASIGWDGADPVRSFI
ncbi:MAG TPA: VOC family protein [Steroidobacteraceae bacterium]|nr:VOC family protein [Steroidobacteraceae bacterium]